MLISDDEMCTLWCSLCCTNTKMASWSEYIMGVKDVKQVLNLIHICLYSWVVIKELHLIICRYFAFKISHYDYLLLSLL